MLFILFSCAYLGLSDSGRPQQSKPAEYQVKAVYLYNFGRFVTWPIVGKDEAPFVICILGRDPFGPILDNTLAGESIDKQKLVARRISNVREIGTCRILFIASSEANYTKEILSTVDKAAVLTVSDMPNFTASGGMIQFLLQDNKVRFEVNLATADRAGLNFSSQLLKVATAIKREPLREDPNR